MQITAKHERAPECKLKISVEIPFNELESEYKKVKEDLKKDVVIPGFRKGKVPETIIENRYKTALQGQVIENILPKAYSQAISDNSLKAFGQPEAKEVSEFKDNEPLKVEFSVDRMPECTIKKIDGLNLILDEYIVDENDIKFEIDRNLRRKAEFNDSKKPSAMGNLLKVDITTEDKALDSLNLADYSIELNEYAKAPYDLKKDLIGLTVGQPKKVDKKYDKKNENKLLAGKKVTFTLTAKEVKTITLPELTDELLKELSYKSVEDMNQKTKAYLEAKADDQTDGSVRKVVLDQIRENCTFEIPKSIIDYTTQQYLGQFKQQFGNNPEIFNSFLESSKQGGRDIIAEYNDISLYNIQNDLILTKIGDENKIEVSDETLKDEIAKIAKRMERDPKELKKEMLKSGGYTNLKNNLKNKELISYIITKNKAKKGRKINISEQ